MSAVAVALGLAWGALAGCAVLALRRRFAVVARARALAVDRSATRRRARPAAVRHLPRLAAPLGAAATRVRALAGQRAARREHARIERRLPVVLDLLVVAASAGLTPYLAIEHTLRWAPDVVATPLREALRLARLGLPFADALDRVGHDVAPLRQVASILAASVRTGAPVAEPLARLAADRRADARRRAAERARALSVRLLFPLVFLVLPAFGLLVVAPTLLEAFRTIAG